jgi:hypothetical protein
MAKWGKFTSKWPNSPQKGSLGVLIHPKTAQSVEISKFPKFRFLVARSTNLAKAGLMSPPPELSIFSDIQIALFRRVLPGGRS